MSEHKKRKRKKSISKNIIKSKRSETLKQSQEIQQQPPKSYWKILKSLLSSFVFWLTLAISIAGFLFVVWPRISVSPGESLNPYDPFSIPLVIKNDGYLTLLNIRYSLTVKNAEFDGNSKITNGDYSDIGEPSLIPNLKPNMTSSIRIPFDYGLGNRKIKSAEIYVTLRYKSYLIPYSFTLNVRFKTAKKSNGEYIWLTYFSEK